MDIFDLEEDTEITASLTQSQQEIEAMWRDEVRSSSESNRHRSESGVDLTHGTELVINDRNLGDTTLSDLDLTLDLNQTDAPQIAMQEAHKWDEGGVPEPVETLLRQSVGSSPVEYEEFQAFAEQWRRSKRKQVLEVIDLTEDDDNEAEEDEVVEVYRSVGDAKINGTNPNIALSSSGSSGTAISTSHIVNGRYADPRRLFGSKTVGRTHLVKQQRGHHLCNIVDPMTSRGLEHKLSLRKETEDTNPEPVSKAPRSLLKPLAARLTEVKILKRR